MDTTPIATPFIHPLKLRHTYRLLATLPLGKRSNNEIEQLADRLASARSLLELNRLIRPLRQDSDQASSPY